MNSLARLRATDCVLPLRYLQIEATELQDWLGLLRVAVAAKREAPIGLLTGDSPIQPTDRIVLCRECGCDQSLGCEVYDKQTYRHLLDQDRLELCELLV